MNESRFLLTLVLALAAPALASLAAGPADPEPVRLWSASWAPRPAGIWPRRC